MKTLFISSAHEDWGYCQAGTSAMLTKDNMALIGSPGPFTWRGTVFAVSVEQDFLFRDKTHYHTPVKGNDAPVGKYSYMGMSVAAGDFLPESRTCGQHMSYASGAPRAGGTGKVLIFVKCSQELMRVERVLTGEKFASSFGYTLATIDINGDDRQDLFVGAPFYHQESPQHTGGAVYLYLNSEDNGITDRPERLVGKSESRFGFSIASGGDLNNDGYNDVVIGAPYDDGGGKVYVYMGSKKGLNSNSKPDQVIAGRDLPYINIKTFGYSLSGGIDMDMNNHSDIVVGAYESDTAVIIRARPVVDIITWFGKKPSSIDPELYGCEGDVYSDEVCFLIESCFLIKNFPPNIETTHIRYRLAAEVFSGGRMVSRIRFGDARSNATHVRENTVAVERKSLTGCFHETAYLKSGTSDLRTPIKFLLSLRLQQDEPRYNGADYGVPNINQYPILNQQEAQKELTIPFHKSCGDDDLCHSNLEATLDIVGMNTETGSLEISEGGDVVLNVTVSNPGEPAYSADMELIFDEAFSYVGRSDQFSDLHCDFVPKNRIRCNLGNPYDSKRTDNLIFRIRPILARRFVNFEIKTNTSSEDLGGEGARYQKIKVRLIKRAELSIRSSVEPKHIWFGGGSNDGGGASKTNDRHTVPRVMSDIGHKITHTFQVTNDGPWHVENMDVLIDWPYKLNLRADEDIEDETAGQNKRKRVEDWLLYLTEPPEITPREAGQCYINPRKINALGLRQGPSSGRIIHSRSSNLQIPFENPRQLYSFSKSHERSNSVTTKYHYRSSGSFSSFSEATSSLHSKDNIHRTKQHPQKRKRKRRKRSLNSAHLATHTTNDLPYQNYDDNSRGRSDISSSEYSEDITNSDNSVGWTATSSHSNSPYNSFSTLDYSRAVMLDCSGDKIKCHIFDCRLNGLRANESVVIRFRSRLWNSTLVEKFGDGNAELIVLQTRGRLALPENLDIHQSVINNDITVASLVGIPRKSESSGGIESVPLWIILLSVAIGLVVVVCIAFTLWKLGFFRRNRVSDDHMISAKIMHSNNTCGVAQYHDREDEYMS